MRTMRSSASTTISISAIERSTLSKKSFDTVVCFSVDAISSKARARSPISSARVGPPDSISSPRPMRRARAANDSMGPDRPPATPMADRMDSVTSITPMPMPVSEKAVDWLRMRPCRRAIATWISPAMLSVESSRITAPSTWRPTTAGAATRRCPGWWSLVGRPVSSASRTHGASMRCTPSSPSVSASRSTRPSASTTSADDTPG